ncbi:MAG: hypothetical protein ACOC5F_06590, partial [Candidatus Aminicenantaceae bacterium]
ESKETKKEVKEDKKKEEAAEKEKVEKEKKEPEEQKKGGGEEEKKPSEKLPVSPQKKKKINQMTLSEIEAKLEETKKTMGGTDSKYVQKLMERKEYLESLK